MLIRVIGVAAVLAVCATSAYARTKPVSLRDQEQAACYDDAKRLCGQYFPDEAKVTSCMKPMKAQVSAECAKFYK